MLSPSDRERRCGTALADDENIVGIRVRLDHSHFCARLRTDDDLDAALVEVLDRFKSLRRIELRVADKKLEPISAVMANRFCFKLLLGDLQRCNRVLPKRRPRACYRREHANLKHPLGM